MNIVYRITGLAAVLVVGVPVLPVAVIVIAAWEWRHR